MSATDLEVRLSDPDLQEDNRFSHYVRKDDAMSGYVEGTPIKALCGLVWVPSRDPNRYPVCQRCKDVLSQMASASSN
jgi:hypothetical protein